MESTFSQLQVDFTDNLLLVDSSDPNIELEKKEFFLKVDHAINQLPHQTLLVFRLIKEAGKNIKKWLIYWIFIIKEGGL